MSDLTDIHSPFNACMFREHCRGEIDRLRVTNKMLQDDKAALMADNANLQNNVVMPLRRRVDALEAERDALREQLTLAESVRAAQVAGLVQGAENLQKAVEYYRAGIEHRAPKWVPSKVWLAGPVRGDHPIGHTTIAHEGEYDCESNRYGAVSVVAENGQRLGLKPSEFEVVAWRENTLGGGNG